MGKIDALAAIRKFYADHSGRYKLTDKQEEIRKRLAAAYALLRTGITMTDAMATFAKEWDVSEPQAYRDFRAAIDLFGDVQKAEKEGIRWIVYNLALETYVKAREASDFKAMAQAVDRMSKVMGLEKDDPDLPNFEKMTIANILLAIPPEVEAPMLQLLQAGAVNFSKLRANAAKFEEAEEVADE